MTLLRNGKVVSTIFDVLGTHENDMTAALALVMSRSEQFRARIMRSISGLRISSVADTTVEIQTSRSGEGITDIEIDASPELFAVIEAKRGPLMPGKNQLVRYASVVSRNPARHKFLVTVSNTTNDVAKIHLDRMKFRGIFLRHLSWRTVRADALGAITGETLANRLILREFAEYLESLLKMDTKYSNLVYVVSLAKGCPEGWDISWIDIVEKRNRYFYPIGINGWPDPPNYLGFRYAGKLQSIRRVVSYDTNNVPREIFPEAKAGRWLPHYVLKLGPPIVPQREIPNGPSVLRANRCWCMIDALLTSRTISDALAETKKRQAEDVLR